MRPVEDLERELARVTAERDAMARHVEALAKPASDAESKRLFDAMYNALKYTDLEVDMRRAFDAIITDRQRAGQFAAFG